MKSPGVSAAFYFIVCVSLLSIFLLSPYPHYNPETKGWFLGASVASRILGNKEELGVPLDALVRNISDSSITSSFELTCESDEDCREYIITNQCKVYCGNLSAGNSQALVLLNNQRVCDPGLWSPPKLNCKCVASKCLDLN